MCHVLVLGHRRRTFWGILFASFVHVGLVEQALESRLASPPPSEPLLVKEILVAQQP